MSDNMKILKLLKNTTIEELDVLKKVGFVSWVKKIVSRNVFLYKLWFYSVRKYRGDYSELPSVNDKLYIDGYPRSGTTFFSGLVRRVYPNKTFSNHLHVISGLKIALRFKLPIFVILREPKDAIISNLYRNIRDNKRKKPTHKLIEALVISYYNYYLFVSNQIDNINLFVFRKCIKNELLLVQRIAEIADFNKQPNSSLRKLLDDYYTNMRQKEASKDPQSSSLPNSQREKFKKEYLTKVINSPSYNMVEKIYTELVEYDSLNRE